MTVTSFDTLKLVRALRDKAGFSPSQAEGMADAIAEAVQGDLATKADLRQTDMAIRGDLREVEAALKADLRELRASTKADLKELSASTKADLKELSASTKADFREAELRLELKIESTKTEIVRWLVVTQIGLVGFIFTIMKFVH